jgi:hypothetical protein
MAGVYETWTVYCKDPFPGRITAGGSAAGRRVATIHRRRPAAKPPCQREAPTAAGMQARTPQTAAGQLQPFVGEAWQRVRARNFGPVRDPARKSLLTNPLRRRPTRTADAGRSKET